MSFAWHSHIACSSQAEKEQLKKQLEDREQEAEPDSGPQEHIPMLKTEDIDVCNDLAPK